MTDAPPRSVPPASAPAPAPAPAPTAAPLDTLPPVQDVLHPFQPSQPDPALLQHARVATLLYDLAVRPLHVPTLPPPLPPGSTLPADLRAAYPAAAALADDLAASAGVGARARASTLAQWAFRPGVGLGGHAGGGGAGDGGGGGGGGADDTAIVFRRVNVTSVARVFAFVGALLFSLRLWVILSLALASALASSAANAAAERLVEQVVESALARSYDLELYRWLLGMLVDDAPTSAAFEGVGLEEPDAPVFVLAFLTSPFLAALLCYVVGMVFASAVNTVLAAVGGIRVEQPRVELARQPHPPHPHAHFD